MDERGTMERINKTLHLANLRYGQLARLVGATVALLVGLVTIYVSIVPDRSGGKPEHGSSSLSPQPTGQGAQTFPGPGSTLDPRLVTQVDRSDEFASPSSQWSNYAEESGATGYEKGLYFIETGPGLWLSRWKEAGIVGDATLQVDVLSVDDVICEQGIAFGWHEGWTEPAYGFCVSSEGSWSLVWSKAGWKPLAGGSIDSFDSTAAYHQVLTSIRSGEVSCYVDGVLCVRYRLPEYTGGYVGVVAAPDQGRARMFFDHFRIYALP